MYRKKLNRGGQCENFDTGSLAEALNQPLEDLSHSLDQRFGLTTKDFALFISRLSETMYVHPVPVQDEKAIISLYLWSKNENSKTQQEKKYFHTTVNIKWHDSLAICPEYELEICLLKSYN